MSKSYKSGPRFGPSAWTWKNKEREKSISVVDEKEEVVVTPPAIPVVEQKVEKVAPILEIPQVVEEKVEEPIATTIVEEKIEIKSATKKK